MVPLWYNTVQWYILLTGGIWREHIIHWHNSYIGKQDPDYGLQGKVMAKKMSRKRE